MVVDSIQIASGDIRGGERLKIPLWENGEVMSPRGTAACSWKPCGGLVEGPWNVRTDADKSHRCFLQW